MFGDKDYLLSHNIIREGEKGYELNTVALDMNFSESGKRVGVQYTATGTAYVVKLDQKEFQQESQVVSIDVLTAEARVTQPNPRKPFKCNFSFNLNLGIKIELPDLNSPPPNFDLLYSIYNFTQEVEKINETLIYALKEMKCCDLEKAYNKTLIPFFRWFADDKSIKYCSYEPDASNDCGPFISGNTFPMTMYNIAKTLIQLYIVVRPLICLLRPVPGNPWYPFDIDQAYFIKFLIMAFDLYYDLIISGSLFDATFTNPTRQIRQLIEICIYGKNAEAAAKLNLSVIEYNMILGQLKVLQDKIAAAQKLANKYEVEYKTYYNASIIIDVIKNSSKTLYQNLPDIITADINRNTSAGTTLKFSTSEFFCLKKGEFLVNDCKEKAKNLICNSDALIFLLDSGVNIEYRIEVGKNIIVHNSFTCSSLSDEDSFANQFINDIKNYYKTYVKPKKIKYEAERETLSILKKQHEVILNQLNARATAKKTHSYNYDNSIMPKDFLNKASILKMANNNSICDCLITVGEILFDKEFNVPMPETIKSFTKDGFSKVAGKESFKIKFGDMKTDNPQHFYNICIKDLEVVDNVKDKGIFYCDEFLNRVTGEIQSLTNTFTPTVNFSGLKIDPGIRGVSDGNLVSNDTPPIVNFLKNKNAIDNLFNPQSVAYNYLYALNKSFNTELKILFKIKSESKSIKFPDNTTINFHSLEFSKDYFPTDVYPANFGIFLLSLQKTRNQIDLVVSELQRYYLYKKNEDYDKWSDAIFAINNYLNKVNEKLSKQLDNFSNLAKLKKTQNDLKYLQSLLSKYPSFEIRFRDNPFGTTWDIDEVNSFDMQKIWDAYQYAQDASTESTNYKNYLTIVANKLQTFYETRKRILTSKADSDFSGIQDFDYPIYQYFYLLKLQSQLSEYLNDEYIVTDWVWEKPDIPCTCDGIICKIIQTIINMILSMLSQFIQRVFNYLMDLLWKSPIGKLLKFILAKLKCAMMVVNIRNDLEHLNQLLDNLRESLKNNVKLYTDPSICLNQAVNNFTPDFPLQYDPNTNLVTYPDSVTPDNLNNNLFDTPSITGNDINDPNYEPTDINISQDDNGVVKIQTSGGDIPEPFKLVFHKNVNGLPAILVVTQQVNVGSVIKYPNHKFPLLTFNCNCDSGCQMCNEETKVETENELNE